MHTDRNRVIWQSHLRTAEQVLAHYEGEEPFPFFLKAFFRENPKFGSKDRRRIGQLCFHFFRLGQALSGHPILDRILAGHLLSATAEDIEASGLLPGLASPPGGDASERMAQLAHLYPDFSASDIFPAIDQLSDNIDMPGFIQSHFIQPDLFIRLRPGRVAAVTDRLSRSGIPYQFESATAVRLPNGSSLESLGVADRDFVVQDLSSQRTADWMPPTKALPARPRILDLCAGSGGKSILANDRYLGSTLQASDIRPTMLKNLEARFRTASIRRFTVVTEDLTTAVDKKNPETPPGDLVIVDAPCSGSGTWARTPWEMAMFDPQRIGEYQQLQRALISGALRRVAPGGHFLYITCSVYRAENEENRDFIQAKGGFRLVRSSLLKGYDAKADSMYVAHFISLS